MRLNTRCNICPNVSHSEICSDFHDFHPNSFYPDPDGRGGYICSDCHEAYMSVKSSYRNRDELSEKHPDYAMDEYFDEELTI